MFPFRNQPQGIDRVICANCGKPAWDHFISNAGAECDGPRVSGPCRFFSLTFTEISESSGEKRTYHLPSRFALSE